MNLNFRLAKVFVTDPANGKFFLESVEWIKSASLSKALALAIDLEQYSETGDQYDRQGLDESTGITDGEFAWAALTEGVYLFVFQEGTYWFDKLSRVQALSYAEKIELESLVSEAVMNVVECPFKELDDVSNERHHSAV